MSERRDERLALALRQLPPGRAAELRRELAASGPERAEWLTDERALLALVEGLEPLTPPPGAEARLLARAAREIGPPQGPLPLPAPPRPLTLPPATPPTRRRWLLPALLAAALLAGVWWLRPANEFARYARQPGAQAYALTLDGGASARLLRLRGGEVVVSLPPPAQGGQVYQLWQLGPGAPVSLGVFERVLVVRGVPQGQTLAVSVEPPGGSPAPTTEPLFTHKL